jgi:hypothetical protein
MAGAFVTRCIYCVGNTIEPLNNSACCFERNLYRVRGYLLDVARNCRAVLFALKAMGEISDRGKLATRAALGTRHMDILCALKSLRGNTVSRLIIYSSFM